MLEVLASFLSSLPKSTEELEELAEKGEIYDLSATSRRLDGKTRLFASGPMLDRLMADGELSAEKMEEKVRRLLTDVLQAAIQVVCRYIETTGREDFNYPIYVGYWRPDFFGGPVGVAAIIAETHVVYVDLIDEG